MDFFRASQNQSASQLPADISCRGDFPVLIGVTNRAWPRHPLKSNPVTALIPPFLSLVNHEKIMIKQTFFKPSSKFRTFHELKKMKPTFLYQ